MAKEIEHKYLVINNDYKCMASNKYEICQGYISREIERVVRIRIKGDRSFLTIKGKNQGDSRDEFEYEIPMADACQLLEMCVPPIIRKTRYIVDFGGYIWEVDEFKSPKEMTVAEIELPSSDTEYPLPAFIGEDVTGDPQYYNSNL